ncbi:MAG: flagellar basal body P-ring formation chaperone FlgA [Xanthomonadales bacterium]|nr:flagellar basal body P-ring formation chaperone FlgA [Xanthomonadales bacterium]
MTLCAAVYGAEPVQDLSEIQRTAEAYLINTAQLHAGAETTVSVNAPDRRLRLARCDQPLEAFMPPAARHVGATSVGIRCAGPRTWTIYLQAKVSLWQTVAVTNRALSRGDLLKAGDVRLQKTDVSYLTGGYFEGSEELVGQSLLRPLAPGVVVTPNMVRPPIVVRRGEPVVLLSSAGNLEVRTRGRALADGAMGQRIDVENSRNKKRLHGVVAGRGLVRMDG